MRRDLLGCGAGHDRDWDARSPGSCDVDVVVSDPITNHREAVLHRLEVLLFDARVRRDKDQLRLRDRCAKGLDIGSDEQIHTELVSEAPFPLDLRELMRGDEDRSGGVANALRCRCRCADGHVTFWCVGKPASQKRRVVAESSVRAGRATRPRSAT